MSSLGWKASRQRLCHGCTTAAGPPMGPTGLLFHLSKARVRRCFNQTARRALLRHIRTTGNSVHRPCQDGQARDVCTGRPIYGLLHTGLT
eukprot:51582-Eustigmatos_ZCMA.PRE.2